MTTLMPASSTGLVVTQAGPPVRVRLPTGGWQVGFRAQPDGHAVIEVTDPGGSLADLVSSIPLPILSIDAGWAGCVGRPCEGSQWWALAIGHVPTGAGQPRVTFFRRTRREGRGRSALPADAVDGLWIAHDGLWVAAAAGHHTHVRVTATSATRVRRLRLVTEPPAAPARRHRV